jgi:hypothetical protein
MTANTTPSGTTPSTGWQTSAVNHLASVEVRAVPGTDLAGTRWVLGVKVDVPSAGKPPAWWSSSSAGTTRCSAVWCT